MRQILLGAVAAVFTFLAFLMVAAAAGMMDTGAEILVCVKLIACAGLSMVAAAGFSDLRRV